MRADYAGHESVRQQILNRAPRFGNDDYVDDIAKEIAEYFLGRFLYPLNNLGDTTPCPRFPRRMW